MKKRVFLIHGWDGKPSDGWYPWLVDKLSAEGFKVIVPAMPNTSEPRLTEWVSSLSKIIGKVDENTFFVGHSIGCQAVIRYLEFLPKDKKIGGVVFVAGWFTLANLSSEEEWEIAKPWLETPIDFEKVKRHTKNLVAIFSDDDSWVPINNKDLFEKRLGAKVIIEHKMKHFSGDDGINILPSVKETILLMAGNKL